MIATEWPSKARVARGHWLLMVRLALRDLRGGVRGFYVFIAAIAIGVMAIAGVGSLAHGLAEGLAREGRVIIGGDVAFSLIHREASQEERAFLQRQGDLSVVATVRAMARSSDGASALVEIKAVDGVYPLFGQVETEANTDLAVLLAANGEVFGAVAEPTLLARLGVQPGARISIGRVTLELRAALKREPDKLAGGLALGPRVLISADALRASGLIQPGSLVRWHYRVRLPDNQAVDRATRAVVDAATRRFPEAGWEIRTRSNASPQLERDVERFTQYLTLVGLTALLVGGIGVANSAKHYLDSKRRVIATMKSLGAAGTSVAVMYFVEILVLALVAVAIGVCLGAVLPFAAATLLAPMLPVAFVPALYPVELLLAAGYGLLTAVAFALWPLGRAHDVRAAALFRDEVAPERVVPRFGYMVAAAVAATALAALAIGAAYDRKIATIFVVSAVVALLALRSIAGLLMWSARKLPHSRSTALRLAIANMHRPGALTPTVVLSLGLGLTLLVAVLEIDGNLRQQFTAEMPQKAPSFYFLDIQPADAEGFDAFIRARAAGGKLERVPMLRGRIISVNGVKAEDMKPRKDTAWVLQSDRGITVSEQVPAGSRVVEGAWWTGEERSPLVSFDKGIASGLGLKVGDEITVNVMGRNVTARVANLRALDWQSLGINFIMVFSPASFRGAPSADIATLTYSGGSTVEEEMALLKALTVEFPLVTAVRVKDALDAIGGLVANIILAVRGASAVTLAVAAIVLGGALAAGQRHRVYDAVVLKTLGATRRQLIAAYGLEYILLGLATAVFGVIAGSIAGWGIVSRMMTLPFTWLPGPAAAAAAGALAVTLVFGLWGTFHALGRKPATILRNL